MLGLITAGVGGEERCREGEQHPHAYYKARVIGVTAAAVASAVAAAAPFTTTTTTSTSNLTFHTRTPVGARSARYTSTEPTAAATLCVLPWRVGQYS